MSNSKYNFALKKKKKKGSEKVKDGYLSPTSPKNKKPKDLKKK